MSAAPIKKHMGINGTACIKQVFSKIQSKHKRHTFNRGILAQWGRGHVNQVAQAPPLGQFQVFCQGFCYCSQTPPASESSAQGRSDSGWRRFRRKHERRTCLLLGPWLLKFPWLATPSTPSFSILCVLSPRLWEGHGVSTSHSVPRFSTLYLVLTFSPRGPSQNMRLAADPNGEENHLYGNKELTPTRPSQSGGNGQSPHCTPISRPFSTFLFSCLDFSRLCIHERKLLTGNDALEKHLFTQVIY